MADEHALMILRAPFEHRGDECDPEAGAPVPAQVRQARAFVVLVLRQVGICELGDRNEHEGIAETLVSTRARRNESSRSGWSIRCSRNIESAAIVKLAASRRFAPIRGTIRTTNGASNVITAAPGPSTSPASVAVYPNSVCRISGISTVLPNSPNAKRK